MSMLTKSGFAPRVASLKTWARRDITDYLKGCCNHIRTRGSAVSTKNYHNSMVSGSSFNSFAPAVWQLFGADNIKQVGVIRVNKTQVTQHVDEPLPESEWSHTPELCNVLVGVHPEPVLLSVYDETVLFGEGDVFVLPLRAPHSVQLTAASLPWHCVRFDMQITSEEWLTIYAENASQFDPNSDYS